MIIVIIIIIKMKTVYFLVGIIVGFLLYTSVKISYHINVRH